MLFFQTLGKWPKRERGPRECSVGVENGAGRETDSAIGLGISCAALFLGLTNPIETSFEMEVGAGAARAAVVVSQPRNGD